MSNSIPFSSIQFRERARTTYSNIDLLAESIATVGLQCPIILSPLPDNQFLLEDGGRRYRALESLGVTELFHAVTGDPLRPGYVLKSEVSTEAAAKLTELIANLHREDLDWRDEVRLLVGAYRLRKTAADLAGEKLYYSTFGKMVGNYSHCDVNAAIMIHDELLAHPEKFKDCKALHGAYAVFLKETQREAEAELARRALAPTVASPVAALSTTTDAATFVVSPSPVISLSSQFRLGNSLDWMEHENPIFDHIICDPDFAVSKERLEASTVGASAGVAQDSIEDSLDDLKWLINLAAASVRSYFIFFYDLDHHEKLQAWCTGAGFAVQRWPILWHKTDYRSNAAPQHNFTKNMEYAMVCRKPSATLALPAPSGVIALPSGDTTKSFGHPFAKPVDLWLRIFAAVCQPGQTVFDPFMGSGSSSVAAVRFGLAASGMELQSQHFNSAILNLQKEYLRVNPTATFA